MKKLSRRQFLQLSAVAAAGSLWAACAPKATEEPKEKPEEKPTEKPAEPEEIKLSIMWRTNPTENPMVDDLIAKWGEKQPNIVVESIVVPWDEYEPKLMTMYAGDIAPDIYGTGGTNPYIERYFRGMVVELDPYVEAEGADFLEDLYPVGVKSYTKNGKLVAMTFAVLNAGVFMNATRFDEAGVDYPPVSWEDDTWTWEAMIETAKKLTLDTDGDGKTDRYGVNTGHWSPWTYTRLWGQDLVSDEDYASGICHKWQTDKPEVYDALVEGLQARADAIHKHNVTPSPETAQSLGQMGPMLKTGAVAMDFTGGWAIWGDLPEEFGFRAAANPIGGVNGSGTRVKNTWAEPLQICSKTAHPDEAWQWVKFMTVDKDAIAIEIKYRSMIPAARSAFEAYVAEYGPRLAMNEEEQRTFYREAIEQAETTVPCHILVGWAAARDIFAGEMEPIWLGEKSAKEAVNEMIPKVNQRLEENLKELNLS